MNSYFYKQPFALNFLVSIHYWYHTSKSFVLLLLTGTKCLERRFSLVSVLNQANFSNSTIYKLMLNELISNVKLMCINYDFVQFLY